MKSSHNLDGIDTIMPGEIRGTHTSIHFNKNNIPWKIENGQKVIRIAIVCAAYYASESSSSKFTTQRCFLIGTIEANNPGKHLYITERDFDDIENKKLVTPLHGWVHTT